MSIALQWIGFGDINEADAVRLELGEITELVTINYKDIRDLRDGFGSRRVADGRIIFGMARTKRLQGMTDWARDKARLGEPVTLDGMNQAAFIREISMAMERQEVRKSHEDTMETRAKAAAPGKLTSENMWDEWEAKLVNHLSILTGAAGVPLVYVIREEADPDPAAVYESYVEKCIAKCPLDGPKFEADNQSVHQIIEACTVGENAEQWIKSVRSRKSGRQDMELLRAHYTGEGNQTRRVADAERLRDTLHYKSEGAMPFSNFLSKCQKMFNLFEQSGEGYTEAMKLRFLFEKVQNAELKTTVEALKSSVSLNADSYNFASAANHIAAQVKPRATRQLNAVDTSQGGTISDKSAIMGRDGNINTGHHKNWWKYTQELRDLVIAERDRKGTRGGSGGQGGKGGSRKLKKLQAEVKKWQSSADKYKAKVASLKRSATEGTEDSSDDEVDAQAGNAFGGRNEKAAKKKSKKA